MELYLHWDNFTFIPKHYQIRNVFLSYVILFLGLYEPKKPSRRRHYGKRDTAQTNMQLAHAISERKRIDKREVQHKQIVSITLGVRGLMVGSDADLISHGLVKRDADTSSIRKSHTMTELKYSELHLHSVPAFTVLSALVGSAIMMLFIASVTYFLAQRPKKIKVISITPQLLKKGKDQIQRNGLN
jgi:hypothetical protein